ncbi:MAG: type VI secretion system membrane subunit TssM [Pseudomonadota bacterium]|nr:type VI secretion system membrane subunit TssM [Pseudomonadota bacterium]
MNKVLQYLLHPLAFALYGFLLLAALIWWVAPLIPLGGHHPFDGSGARLLAILLLALLWGLVLLIGWLRRRRANAALVEGLRGGASAADREVQVLDKRFSEALQVLEESARKSGRKGLLNRGQYLYELPWYVFIGAPGSGKTTALMNAGLNFPLSARMGQAPIKGVGGTRNCDWWFTDSAVMIDTAGRYTLQQSDEKVDAAAWEGFLDLLRRTRPLRPINGVLLTVNVQDLLQQGPAERKEHAARLRARLQELHQRLGVRPPIYVMLTKCDLIAGFNESFGELPKEARDQVWGFSFPHDPHGRNNPIQEFAAEFAALEKRLRERLLTLIEGERDVLKRAAIFAFPQQFGGLKGLLGGFLEQVFEGAGKLDEAALLRGVYFTSGTQEGTPIDRVMGTLARTFGVDSRAAAIASARGKSFFLTRLLRDVVFAEQGLVGENRQVEQRRRRLRQLGLAATALLALLLCIGWGVSYQRNSAHIAEVAARVPDLRKAVDSLPPAAGSELATLPQVLDALSTAARSEHFDTAHPPLLNGLGLYQGDYLQAGADLGYHHLLDHALLPRVTRRLEERLRAANRDNLEYAYEALKAYLMLYTPEHFDADALRNWIVLDWDNNLANVLNSDQRAALAGHLDAALAGGAPTMPTPMDANLVAGVREMLVAYPLDYRIFSRLRRARVGAEFPEFSVAAAGGPAAAEVFERASGQPLTRGVPGLFTREGYFKGFKNAVDKVAHQLADEQSWVLGTPAPSALPNLGQDKVAAALGKDDALDERVRRLYLQEYIKVWDAYLADVRLVRLDGIDRSLAVARVLAAPDSPLSGYLRGVDRETQLAAVLAAADAAGGATAAGDAALAKLKNKATSPGAAELALLAGAGPAPAGAAAKGEPLEAMVDQHFSYIHRLVSGTPPPLDDVLKQFNEVYVQLNAVAEAQKSKSAPPPPSGNAKASAGLLPEPLKSMLSNLADAGANQSRSAERQGLSSDLKPVVDQCVRTIAGRFPFAAGARADVLPDDFGQMFGVGGQLDDFYQRKLAALVDTGANPWRFKPLPDGSTPPGGAALADFQRAARIREVFFRAGGKLPGFKVDVRALDMADGLKEVNLDIDGQAFHFTAGNTAAQTLSWPSTKVASQIHLSGAAGGAVQTFEGPWALFRLFNQFEIQPSPQPEKFVVVLLVDGRKARLEVTSSSAINPLRMREISAFRCPDAL